jgi:hypothetical protein
VAKYAPTFLPIVYVSNCVKLQLAGDKRGPTGLTQMPMLRLFALSALVVNPPLYLAMKGSAYARHRVFKNVVEQDDTPLEDTWHQGALDWVYPI